MFRKFLIKARLDGHIELFSSHKHTKLEVGLAERRECFQERGFTMFESGLKTKFQAARLKSC